MKKFNLGLYIGVVVWLFAAGSVSQAGIFTNVHAFVSGSVSDGSAPNDTILVNGQLFGSAQQGGASGNGMVYTVGTNGTGFASVHDFDGANDGSSPNELLLVNDMIYGTTFIGGSGGNGTIYKVNTNGSGFTVLRSFTNSPDPSVCFSGLTLSGNTLYGTSAFGGAFSAGTVFEIDTNGGNFTVLHNFTNNPDGATARCRPVLIGSTLYGTTSDGSPGTAGTIFKINTDGSGYGVLWPFSNGPAGIRPQTGLTFDNNALYGVTTAGGISNAGAVFRIDTSGAEYTVLHSLTNNEGFSPQGALLVSNGMLYGTATGKGAGTNGIIFQLATNGANFSVLKNFTNALSGGAPKGQLVMSGNSLYGIASVAGPGGGGTVFQLVLAPVINTQPQSQTVTNGNPASFSVIAADELPVTYQWYFNTNTLLAGQTGSTLNLIGVTNGNAGTYTVVVTDNGGSVTSSPAVLTVNAAATVPTINGQPQSLTRTNGDSATFTVTATSNVDGPTYQWYFNTNTLLSGQTGSTLTLSGVTNGNAGAYTVVVGNSIGSVTSSPAVLTVVFPLPNITGQPQSLNRTNGDSASFMVTATTVTGTLTYQWYFNTNTLLSGQTGSTLTLAGVTGGNAGAYTVVVANGGGSVTSSPAMLTVVFPLPNITGQPQSLTVTNGNPASFTVTAMTGTGTLTYQWYFNTNTVIAGQTNSTYAIPFTITNNAGVYTVVVANGGGSVTSSPATLTVSTNSPPVITGQVHDQIVNSGDTVNIFVTVSGLGPMNFQWYTNSVNTSLGKPSSLRINAAFSFPCSTNNNHVYFTCIAGNSLGTATSSPALLTVVGVPLITSNPQPATVGVGGTANFAVTAFGPGLGYQWYSNNVNTAIGTALAGQTNSTYSFTAITDSNGKYYSVVVTNSFGKATSSPALLIVGSLPTITLQPVGATITNGSPITFTSAAAGLGTLGYQWLYQTNVLIPGATGTSLTFATANQPGTYSMMVTNLYGAATSSPALLTVVGRPIILSSAFDPASGSFSFSYVNLAGSVNRLLATTNLANPNAWQAIATNVMVTNGIWQVTDPKTAQTNSIRLYRFSSP